jgi:hypothetical protein
MTVDILWSKGLYQALRGALKDKTLSDDIVKLARGLMTIKPGDILTIEEIHEVQQIRPHLERKEDRTDDFETSWARAYVRAHATGNDTPSPQIKQMGFTSKAAFDYTNAIAQIAKTKAIAQKLRANLSVHSLKESWQIREQYQSLSIAFADIVHLATLKGAAIQQPQECRIETSGNRTLIEAFIDGLSGEPRLRRLVAAGPNAQAQFVKFSEGRTTRQALIAIGQFASQSVDGSKYVQNAHDLMTSLVNDHGIFAVELDNLNNIKAIQGHQ